MSFSHYLRTIPADIDRALQDILQDWANGTTRYAPLVADLCRIFAASCANGKRLRATLVQLGYDLAGGPSDTAITAIACAYEVFQSAILAHDDIIDRSPLRRGQPTLFKQLEARCAPPTHKAADAAHYGVSQAICLGDMGLFLAIQLITDSALPDRLKNRALSYFTQTVIDTIGGQILDVELPYLHHLDNVTSDDLLAICRYKTARYTITGPFLLGALLHDASPQMQHAIQHYGDALGIAFQLKDDILGVFGDADTTGKSATSDIAEGKLTLLYFHAHRHATPDQAAYLAAHYGHGSVTPDVHDAIKTIFTTTGALANTEHLMRDYTQRAIQAIPAISNDTAHHAILHSLADFMITRAK